MKGFEPLVAKITGCILLAGVSFVITKETSAGCDMQSLRDYARDRSANPEAVATAMCNLNAVEVAPWKRIFLWGQVMQSVKSSDPIEKLAAVKSFEIMGFRHFRKVDCVRELAAVCENDEPPIASVALVSLYRLDPQLSEWILFRKRSRKVPIDKDSCYSIQSGGIILPPLKVGDIKSVPDMIKMRELVDARKKV